ncbi:hypothetical protein H257_05215 [Aphanomyces astaci]|uniref:DUF7164 domain-containing protein n=1 Tax=Aphanomyces astaci TaxID=112090 RepID=W4GUR0_APHAT|nr:hypothetical protein H257_05215 [Aphanomyces astaci]ETV82638.1 hypothetical protein H257_05215 [Aphanomyces astaci]|eukprot:XP_009828307.1 hypothetical protein H257_05215 [Aphanomyces astaci]
MREGLVVVRYVGLAMSFCVLVALTVVDLSWWARVQSLLTLPTHGTSLLREHGTTHSSFVRAAVLHVARPDEASFTPMFRRLHRSWIAMSLHEPPSWRTDIVVVTDAPYVFEWLAVLNCSVHPRQNASQPNMCVVATKFAPHSSSSGVNLPPGLDPSIEVFRALSVVSASTYDWLLRTDVDTFLAPGFATYRPNSLAVNVGAYIQPNCGTTTHLDTIAARLNLTSQNVSNIGSTWYGPTALMQTCAAQTVGLMETLYLHDFTDVEKRPAYGNQGWPQWHVGVLGSYAGHLAIRHCTASVGVVLAGNVLNVPSTSVDMASHVAHIHATHDDDDDAILSLPRNNTTKDATTVRDYTLAITLSSSSVLSPSPASITSTFIRAAVVYLPSTEARFLHEFRWFHRSWQAMQAFEPPGWRTDIVVVTNGLVPTLDELNCTSMPREHATDPNRCIVVATYTSLYSPAFPYAYADSVNVLAVTPLGAYDWVLRTDMDTFLTPAFATWKPSLFVVGMGGYNVMGSTNDRLDAIIVQLNLTAKTVDNVGSTWYGPTALVQQCAQLSMDVQMYMYANEFTDEEKSPEYGIKGWPNWHVGVLSMYGGHVAINHCTRDFGVVKDAHNLDFPTTSHESPTRHAHLHTWQDSNRFSKFAFADGAYKNENKSALDLDDISDYAMYMALDSQPRA